MNEWKELLASYYTSTVLRKQAKKQAARARYLQQCVAPLTSAGQPASQPTTAITPIIQQPATTLASHLSPIYPAINSAYCCKKSVFRIHARIERNSRIGAPV